MFGTSVNYKELLAQGALVVDVRTPGEFQMGSVKDSMNIPLFDLPSQMDTLKGKKVVLVCRSGARASQALQFLAHNGIEAYNAGPWQTLN